MMKHNILGDFLLVLLVMASYSHAENPQQRHDVKKYLENIIKPAIKSIKSPDGDIIDCVDIYKQPAFDDHSLKNHTIQMRPNYYPEGLLRESPMDITQLWHNNGTCPEGTIPIIRTKEEDVLRASSIESYGRKKVMSIPKNASAELDLITNYEHQYAVGRVSGEEYFGAKAYINVWKPEVETPKEFSLSQIWIVAGNYGSDLNTVEAGWQVSQDIYGDQNPRFFIYWTSDAYHTTGCYNLKCSGFVQISKKMALGARISSISHYQAEQHEISILVWKDLESRNWWLKYGNELVGYWPDTMFTYLRKTGSSVQWGGEVYLTSDGHRSTTDMGSGHFPDEGSGKASYFRNIQIVDGSNTLREPGKLSSIVNDKNCYDIQFRSGGGWGSYFYYGGPGKNPKCP